jgi:hypothetical protein
MAIWGLVDKIREYYTEFYQPKPKLACKSEGTDEFPEDDT